MKKLLLVLALLSPAANASIGKHCDIVLGMYDNIIKAKKDGVSRGAMAAMLNDSKMEEHKKKAFINYFDVAESIDSKKIFNACYENYTEFGDITKFLEADIYKTVKVN